MLKTDKENIWEISLSGSSINPIDKANKAKYLEMLLTFEEIFGNSATTYNTSIITFVVEYHSEEYSQTISKIEFYQNNKFIQQKANMSQQSQSMDLDAELVYKNIHFLSDISSYLALSQYYIKYISNTVIESNIGNATIVEFARCDNNITNWLLSMGFKVKKQKYNIDKILYTYKNLPIFIWLTNPKSQGNQDTNYQLEINGYCYEYEKVEMTKILEDIKRQWSYLFVFNKEDEKK